jgi:hypothetical protein
MKEVREVFLDIQGYEGLYQISNFGRVKVLTRTVFVEGKKPFVKEGKILNGSKTIDGYLYFALYKDVKRSLFKAHRLVATHFIENPENKPCVNHINGIKEDNSVPNLEWCTSKENAIHAFKTGLRINPKGAEHGCSKLNDQKVLEIKSKYQSGGISYKKLAVQYGVSRSVIYNIMKGNVWTHVILKTA